MNIFEKVDKLINEKKWKQLSKLISEMPAPEVADLLIELDKKQRVIVFRIISRHFAAEVFSYLDSHERDELLLDLTNSETRELLSYLKPDDRTALFRELPGQVTQRLMNLLNPEDLNEAKQLLGYPEESIGRLMTPDYVAVRPDWTIGEAHEYIRTVGRDS
ncbi:MAG: magnesium transporter MgtE N-terminal domain-containing protein [Petrotogales bacterium]